MARLARARRYYDWGLNSDGQLGDDSTRSSSVPVPVSLPDGSGVIQVAQGGSEPYNGQTLVRLADGSLYAWGDNVFDQIGPEGPGVQLAPVPFRAPPGVTYAALASGGAPLTRSPRPATSTPGERTTTARSETGPP